MGNDPPGQFTRVLHPRHGRHGNPPPDVIPIGRSVIVPANGSLPNIILSPRAIFRIRQRARAGAVRRAPPARADDADPVHRRARVLRTGRWSGTFHASGELGWMRIATPVWGFLADRLDRRIAVSEMARDVGGSAGSPGEYEIVPNGVLIPPHADPGGREHRIVFAGRHEAARGCTCCCTPGPRSAAAPAPSCA